MMWGLIRSIVNIVQHHTGILIYLLMNYILPTLLVEREFAILKYTNSLHVTCTIASVVTGHRGYCRHFMIQNPHTKSKASL